MTCRTMRWQPRSIKVPTVEDACQTMGGEMKTFRYESGIIAGETMTVGELIEKLKCLVIDVEGY